MAEKTRISNRMMSTLLSSIPIILVGLGQALSISAGPWTGSAMRRVRRALVWSSYDTLPQIIHLHQIHNYSRAGYEYPCCRL